MQRHLFMRIQSPRATLEALGGEGRPPARPGFCFRAPRLDNGSSYNGVVVVGGEGIITAMMIIISIRRMIMREEEKEEEEENRNEEPKTCTVNNAARPEPY